MKTITAVFLIALLVSHWLTPWVRMLAIRHGVLDLPDHKRRVHTEPIPRWGGLALYLGVVVALLLGLFRLYLLAPSLPVFLDRVIPILGLLGVGTLVLAYGMIDDRRPLSAGVQAVVLLLAGLIVQGFGVRIDGLTNPFVATAKPGFDPSRWVPLGWLAIPVTAFWFLVISKTMDTIDGVDGLAAGVSAIAGMTIALMALQAAQSSHQPYPHWLIAITAAAITGACVGFLRHNFNPANIFLGTGGAQFLGFMLAGLSILGAFKMATAFSLVVPVLIFGLPILDATVVVIRRVLSGHPIHQPDKRHIHHHLLAKGLNQRQVVLLLYMVAILFGGLALWLFTR